MFLKRFDIQDKNEFLARLQKIVDTNCDYDTFNFNRQKLTSEYFGKIEWGRFYIYKMVKGLFSKRILFKVTGDFDSKNILTTKIFPFNFWWTLGSLTLTFIFGIVLLIKFDLTIGVIILFITLTQVLYDIYIFQKHKTKLLTELKTMIKKT